MSVTVIIPTHNRCHILQKTIKTYLDNQLVTEIIIVNDGSTDNTAEWLGNISKTESRIRPFNTESNVGAPEARNIGIRNATKETDYIFWGEDDLFLEKNAIDKLVKTAVEEEADLIGGRVVSFSELNDDKVNCKITNRNPVNISVLRVNFRVHPGKVIEVPLLHAWYLAKKWVFEQVHYDPGYYGNAYREETDVCLEASKKGAKIIYTPFVKLCHMEVPSGGQRRISKLNYEIAVLKNNWYFLNKHHRFLKEKYHVITPKWLYQVMLFLRRVYLLIKKLSGFK